MYSHNISGPLKNQNSLNKFYAPVPMLQNRKPVQGARQLSSPRVQLNISEKDLGRGKMKTVKSTKSIPERVPTMNLTDKLGVKSGTAGLQKRNLQ